METSLDTQRPLSRRPKRLGVLLASLGAVSLVVLIILSYVAPDLPFVGLLGTGPSQETTTTTTRDAQGQMVTTITAVKGVDSKSLWDWAGLLLIPAVLAAGGFYLTRSENRYAQKLQDERELNATLQAYLDQMTQLLLHEHLRTSEEDAEVRSVARARTLTVLRTLDGNRKATIIQFLYEARLIGYPRDYRPHPAHRRVMVSTLRASSGALWQRRSRTQRMC